MQALGSYSDNDPEAEKDRTVFGDYSVGLSMNDAKGGLNAYKEIITLRILAVLAGERGDRAEARRLWRMVLDACLDPKQA